MSYHIQSSFAAGELDPALHERTTFDKYQSGLATLRNAVVGKTGRLVSRAGTKFMIETKYSDRKSIIFSPPYSQYLIEWGHEYVRIHDTTQDAPFYVEEAHTITEGDLDYVQFVPSGLYVYIFCTGYKPMKMVLGDLDLGNPYLDTRFLADAEIFYAPTAPVYFGPALAVGVPAGYPVEYVMTYVYKGQESIMGDVTLSMNVPIAAGQAWKITYDAYGLTEEAPTEFKLYRRPSQGAAFGFVTSTNLISNLGGGHYTGQAVDLGGDADYTHSPPSLEVADTINTNPRAGLVYQQRLIISNDDDEEAIYASRTGYQNNFYRDYPLGADSALSFKAGTTGNAKVLRFLDNNGLIVFTTVGIYGNSGALSPDNLSLDKKGNWVIEETVPPLEIPGGIIFVDKTTNTVRTLIYSNEAGGYPGEEISIFSNHLFLNKRIKSWTFQDGDIPVVWAVMDDGSLNALTFQREHQMQGWSHHDTDGLYESCTTLKTLDNETVTYFVIKRGEKRFIEYTTPRYTENNDLKEFVGMDSTVTFNEDMTVLTGGATFDITAVDIEDWEGQLYINASLGAFTNVAGEGAAGTVYRFFDSQGSAVDLEVVTFISSVKLLVQPSVEFPSDDTDNVTLFNTFSTLTGLGHLEGKIVSVMVDGYVVSSPNNDVEMYEELVVTGGSLTLPDGMLGAFVHVGLPFTVDIETLDIDTVAQKPTLLESRIINKLYLKIYNTRGLFVGSEFPVNDSVYKMVDPEERTEDIELGNIGNAAQKPVTKRLEFGIPNDWKSNGRVCIRQVDPLPVEILSIIPDMTVLY